MSLRTRYSREEAIVSLSTLGCGSEESSYEVGSDCWTILDVAFDNKRKPVTLELMFVSRLMPLTANNGYCSDTDTLVIGKGQITATLVEANDDLSAYWCPDEDYPDDLSLVAVSLQNASKHLTPVLAKLT